MKARLRRSIAVLRKTPLHPQWLLNERDGVKRQLRDLAAGVVLDVGCADRWVERCVPAGCHYLGLDYVATGQGLYSARPDIFGEAGALPLRDASVEAVLALEVLEHVREPRKAFVEMARVLRPGGRLIVTMPFLYPIHDAPYDFQRYTVHGLTREVESAGLQLQQISPSLGSSETAGMLVCLALGGMVLRSVESRSPAVLAIPLAIAAIPVVNVLAWLGGKILPSWPAMTSGYVLQARKA